MNKGNKENCCKIAEKMLDIPLSIYILEFVSINSIYYLKIYTYINLTIINEKINIIEVKIFFSERKSQLICVK